MSKHYSRKERGMYPLLKIYCRLGSCQVAQREISVGWSSLMLIPPHRAPALFSRILRGPSSAAAAGISRYPELSPNGWPSPNATLPARSAYRETNGAARKVSRDNCAWPQRNRTRPPRGETRTTTWIPRDRGVRYRLSLGSSCSGGSDSEKGSWQQL